MKKKEVPLSSDDKADNLDQLVESIVHNVMTAIMADAKSAPDALHIAVSAAGGVVQVISALVSSARILEPDGSHLNEGSVAFATQLIAAAISINTSGREKNICVSAGIDITAKALQNAETVLGRSLDGDLMPPLIAATKDEAAVAKASTRRMRNELSSQVGSSLH
jgi:hypothetical protein